MAIKLYTVAEVAEILKVTRQTVYDYISKKKLPAAQIGKAYRITEKDLDSFISSCKK